MASTELIDAILTMGSDAIIATDRRGFIDFWNPGAERIFGFSAEEAVGASMDIIIPENLRARHWSGFHQVMISGKSRYGAGDMLAVPALTKSGRRISVEFTIAMILDDAHLPVGTVAIIRDVTARFEELRQLRKQLSAQAHDNVARVKQAHQMACPALAPGKTDHGSAEMTTVPTKFTDVTETNITRLVRAFYAKVRVDPEIGPLFERALPNDWEPHLRKMDAFWSSVMLTSGAYKGNPVLKHQAVEGIQQEMFAVWLGLFDETCRELYSDEIADLYQTKAKTIAASLQFMIFEWKRKPESAATV